MINRNRIYGNTQQELYTQIFYQAANTTINAENNWWGSIDLAVRSRDLSFSDSGSSPRVDFVPYWDENGEPVAGEIEHRDCDGRRDVDDSRWPVYHSGECVN